MNYLAFQTKSAMPLGWEKEELMMFNDTLDFHKRGNLDSNYKYFLDED